MIQLKACEPSQIGIKVHPTKPLKIMKVEEEFKKIYEEQVSFDQRLKSIDAYLQKIKAICGQEFATIFFTITNQQSIKTKTVVPVILKLLMKLMNAKHNQEDIIRELKKKKIDAIFVLGLCWCADQKQAYLPIVKLMMDCFPVQLMISGRSYMRKWEEVVEVNLEEGRLRTQIREQLRERSMKEGSKKYKDILMIF